MRRWGKEETIFVQSQVGNFIAEGWKICSNEKSAFQEINVT